MKALQDFKIIGGAICKTENFWIVDFWLFNSQTFYFIINLN